MNIQIKHCTKNRHNEPHNDNTFPDCIPRKFIRENIWRAPKYEYLQFTIRVDNYELYHLTSGSAKAFSNLKNLTMIYFKFHI